MRRSEYRNGYCSHWKRDVAWETLRFVILVERLVECDFVLKVTMLKFLLISALVAGASAGYASSQYAGAGYNGGFASNYVGSGGAGAAAGGAAFTPGFAPYQPVPAYPNAFDFNGFFQQLQSNFANSATQAFATAGATAAASASQYGRYHPHQPNPHYQQRLQQSPGYSYSANYNNHYQNYNGHNSNYDPMNLYQQQIAHQNALFNNIRQQQAAFASQAASAGAGAGTGSGYGSAGFAGASASYGPSGFHQTAQIYPENPNSPNINTRFGGDTPQDGNGFVGVSSFSSSSNINGQTHREAATTVNDNGKVTSYHVRS
ncbi:fibroin heavy chain isoform X2 [Malaya genurostris]|uniref:fibroin heavy chain isoform X2 n=2 Tax=Malaya genurostris TaxID=325434 RepID=UPI0026F38FE5|nr:fibroin heavy chain isoform X2 [Malaya genurostris]